MITIRRLSLWLGALLPALLLLGMFLLAGQAAAAREKLSRTGREGTRTVTESLPLTTTLYLALVQHDAPLPLPPPIAAPLTVVVTTPVDLATVRAALEVDGKELALPKIGFHVGPDDGDVDPELLAWMQTLDAAGIPFFLKSVDNAEPLLAAQELMAASGVSHTLVYRKSGYGFDVPYYQLLPAEAARAHWERHRDAFPPELDPALVWIETVNEVDKERAQWLGEFALETATLTLREGYRWAAFGWSSGEPEADHWEAPAMLYFLRLAAANPDRLAIALHEYSYDAEESGRHYPWLVGRFQLLFEVCDRNRIGRPTVLITEWGWTHELLPPVAEALPQLRWANWLYAAYPEVRGAAIWYLGPEFGEIAELARLLITPLREESLHTYFVREPGWGQIDTTLFRP